jgi:ADP-ribose pyrophosphatase YjhB (NUDIX family)
MPTRPNPLLPIDRPVVTVDLAILTIRDEALNVLLVQRPSTPGEPFPGQWALPGGFIDVERDPDLGACARRKLLEKTGVESPYFEQVGAFGSRSRDPRGWSVTQVYFALMASDGVELRSGANAASVRWCPLRGDGVGTGLAFDHAQLLAATLERVRSKVEYTSLPAFLLPDEFTLPDLQRVYEIVLDRTVEKSAFRKRMLSVGVLDEVPRQRETGKRPAQLYRLVSRSAPVVFPRTFSPRSG